MADHIPASLRYVILGTTGTCNASCIHCPTGKPTTAHVPRMAMPMEIFAKIIDGIVELALPVTELFGFGLFGDGLVDPLVLERAQYLRARLPDSRLVISTNGAAFDEKKHAALFDLVNFVSLHCESVDPATYDRLMQPLRAERVFPKFERILKAFPGKVMVPVPVSQLNLGEISAIRSWFVDRGALGIVPTALFSRCAEDRSMFDAIAVQPVHRVRCEPIIARDLIVDCDGEVLACCQDFQRIEGIGSFRTDNLAGVLADVRRAQARKVMEENRHDEVTTCSRCYAGAAS